MDKAKKKRVKRYITWAALAALVVLLTAMPLLARNSAQTDGPVASVLSAEVTEGSISSAIRGGGTVSAENVEQIKLPDGVKITEFLVKNGQYVTEGTALATVDKVSVMTAITQVNETLEYIREELEDARDETVSSTVTAKAGGRVKKVFAQKGESVQDVMLRDGCLAILSLDGMMAVKIERDLDISTGENVTVTLENGEEVTGRVESNLDGTAVFTVEDNGYEIGQSVSVTDGEGKRLGQGTLYIHNAWKAVAYTGTVETVYAKEEKTLSEGATLFTLTDRDFEGELNRRAGQHREYEELLQDLFTMYETGVLTAPCDGEVEGVDSDSPYLLSAVPESWSAAPLTSEVSETGEKGWTVMLLSNTESFPGCSNDRNCTLENPDAVHGEECIRRCDKSVGCKANTHYSTCLSKCTGKSTCTNAAHREDCKSLCTGKPGCEAPAGKHESRCPEKCTDNALCQSSRPEEEHGDNCIIHCIKDTDASDPGTVCNARNHYSECVGRCSGDKECTAINHRADCYYYGVTYTACVGIVKEVSSNTIKYKYAAEFSQLSAERDTDGKFTITVKPNFTVMNQEGFVSSDTACSPGDVILIVNGTNADGTAVVVNLVTVYQAGAMDVGGLQNSGSVTMGGMSGMSGMDISGMIGGLSGYGNYSGTGTEAQDEGLFDPEGSTVLTVTPKNTATLTISVDEHDIAKLSTGMSATVKLEALKDEEFPAEITAIAFTGTNNGGSSKFAVELTLDMTDDMLSGMSAGAVIPLEEKHGVLLIPAAALVQQGAKTVVYTALDSQGNPTEPVEVTTGLTDGENVEILSGLTKGQKIYYSYYDTVELDTSAEASKYSFG